MEDGFVHTLSKLSTSPLSRFKLLKIQYWVVWEMKTELQLKVER